MTKRISGMSFDAYIDGELIHIEKISLDITDNSAAARPVVCRTAMLMVMWPQREKLKSVLKCFRY